jgi:hypothetical protein
VPLWVQCVVCVGVCVQVWRYYLLKNRPEGSDSVFVWADFADKVHPNNCVMGFVRSCVYASLSTRTYIGLGFTLDTCGQNNNELLKNVGNFVNRALNFSFSKVSLLPVRCELLCVHLCVPLCVPGLCWRVTVGQTPPHTQMLKLKKRT